MSNKTNERFRGVRFPIALDTDIERYADKHGLTYSEAVRDLCDRALAKDFDDQYAPRINETTQQIVDRAVGQIETLLFHAIDMMVTEIRLSELRQATLYNNDTDDIDEGGYNPNVFIPERRPGEKEIIWPR